MKRISQQQHFDLQRQYHYLYRGLPVGATIMDLSSASQVKSLLKKEKITTDKYVDRVNATAMKTSVVYAKKLIQSQHPVLAINTNEKGVTEEFMAVAITEFSLKLAKFSKTLSDKLYNDPSAEGYYATNIMAVPSMTRHLQVCLTHDYAPSPSQAKKDILQLEAMDDQVRSAEDLAIQVIRIDSQDAKLLDIPNVCTVTNKDTRTELNNMCDEMLEFIHKNQDNTAIPVPAAESMPEESEEFFLNLFTSGASSSSSKPVSGNCADSKEDNSDHQKRHSSRKSV